MVATLWRVLLDQHRRQVFQDKTNKMKTKVTKEKANKLINNLDKKRKSKKPVTK
jgi:hypothetical protein